MLNANKLRQDFEILGKKMAGKPIVYFDNSCMTLRPTQVIKAINEYYTEYPSCALRSQHKLSVLATEKFEHSRKVMQKFIGAKSEKEIILTKNTTEGLNLAANGLANSDILKRGDCVLTTGKEHNSNLLPWQVLSQRKGISHRYVEFDNEFNMADFDKKLTKEVKLVSMVYTSNLDGTTIPVKEIIKAAHDNKSMVLLDASQAVPHKKIDVKSLDVDLLAFSGHKMLGPSGTGILYGKTALLEKMSPFIVGGETVKDSTYETATWEELPAKFEAGLQDYAGMIGMAAAAEYLNKIGLEEIAKHEIELNKIITKGLLDHFADSKKLQILGALDASKRGGIFSFNLSKSDPHQIAIMLDSAHNIMLRSGYHCVHSWFNAHKIKGSVRASLYLYNTCEEAEFFVDKVKEISQVL